jgi:hypothetical protein
MVLLCRCCRLPFEERMHDLAISILPAHLGGASSTHRPNPLRAISYCTLSESGVEEQYGNGPFATAIFREPHWVPRGGDSVQSKDIGESLYAQFPTPRSCIDVIETVRAGDCTESLDKAP